MLSSDWPVPSGAVEILPADQGRSAAWHTARAGGIGGSDIATIIGANRQESLYGLWLTKTGRRPPTPDNPLMERGRYLEPAICQYFADKTGLALRRTGTWARLEHDPVTGQDVPGWMRYNPDRFASDGGLVEVKAPAHADWGDLWTRGPAVHAVAQLLWGLAVLALPHGYVAADGPEGLRWWRIERHPDVEAWLIDQAWAFWRWQVCEDQPPEVDGSDATLLALKQASKPPAELAATVEVPGCAAWARRRAELKTALARDKALTKELQEIENLFRAALSGAVTATDGGTPVLSWAWAALDSEKVEPYRTFKEPREDNSGSPRSGKARRGRAAVPAGR